MENRNGLLVLCVALVTASLGAVEWGQAPNGEFWNGCATRFIFAPAFGFKAVEGAEKYVYEVTDDWHRVQTFEATSPTASLKPIWDKLPVGYVTVVCRGIAADGTARGEAGRRTFWKKSAFDDSYPPAERTFSHAYMRVMDAYFNMDQTKYLIRHGRPDPDYYLSGYPSKMLSSQITALVSYANRLSGNHLPLRDKYLGVAKRAADYLIAESVPAGKPLEFFTRTYANGGEYGRFVGQEDRIMLVYPARCGDAFVKLSEATKDAKYLAAAERIAATYLKLQREDGTWFLLQNAETGKEYEPNRLQPQPVIEFFELLFRVTGRAMYREAADRAFAFIEKGPMRDWDWEGQFEDVKPASARWSNQTKHAACATATYLLKRFPGDAARLAQAEELVRFGEDQFVEWTPPYGDRAAPNGRDDGSWDYFCRPYSRWVTPCALEQYQCYYPIDASADRFINTFLTLWRVTKKAEYLAKAKALGAAATRMQEADGFINTWWIRGVERNDDRYHTWVNCMLATARALDNLANAEREVASAGEGR